MNVHTITVGAFAVNCAIVWNDPECAWVLDPGADAGRILHDLNMLGLRPVRYLLTHGHIDHIRALPDLLEHFPAPVMLHERDAAWAFGAFNAIPPYSPMPSPPPNLQTVIEDHRWIRDGDLQTRILATPGHTPGSVCYHFEDASLLFSGDTLFAGSVGRTDLPGGDARVLTDSLDRLRKLAGAIRVIPGHGPQTTMEREQRTNPFLGSRNGTAR